MKTEVEVGVLRKELAAKHQMGLLYNDHLEKVRMWEEECGKLEAAAKEAEQRQAAAQVKVEECEEHLDNIGKVEEYEEHLDNIGKRGAEEDGTDGEEGGAAQSQRGVIEQEVQADGGQGQRGGDE